MPELENAETVQSIDILENDIVKIATQILEILLQDKTTKGNIMWCTKDYESYGSAYEEHRPMKAELITGELSSIIQPRAAKPKELLILCAIAPLNFSEHRSWRDGAVQNLSERYNVYDFTQLKRENGDD